MVLAGTERAADGTSSLLRGIWRAKSSAVRETAERSRDGGTTWTRVFDMEFRPHHQTVAMCHAAVYANEQAEIGSGLAARQCIGVPAGQVPTYHRCTWRSFGH